MDYKKDFPLLNEDIIYFDNSATSLKPISVVEEMKDYYLNYPANAHRGDYDISLKVNNKYEETRIAVKDFINAKNIKEIIFTSGATESLNMIIKGFLPYYLSSNDEILTTKAEHASLILPCFETCKKIGCKMSYIDLNDDMTVSLENVKKAINKRTKVIILAEITNVIGDLRPIKEITEYAHKLGILVIVDGAQSVPHIKTDVQDSDIDFLAFSAHKMLGPTGVGVLYGKEKYLEKLKPLKTGGGMNASFDSLMNVEYKELPEKLESGTQNISGVIAFKKAIDYINNIGIENIEKKEQELKKYMIDKLSKLENVIIYNKDIKNGIVTFNVDKVFAQDVAAYLNKKNICIRVGNHCAKILSEVLGVKNTCRVSLYFYNTKEEIDKLVEALDNDNILYESI